MAFTTDLWGLVLDLKKRFDSLDTHRQFITLAIGSLICSFLYGYLLDGWVREDLRESPVTVAQSENLFALIAACTHALLSAAERGLRLNSSFINNNEPIQSPENSPKKPIPSTDTEPIPSPIKDSPQPQSLLNSNLPTYKKIFHHKASLRSYIVYSFLESCGVLCLNWSLKYIDKHVCAIFKSYKIIIILICEVFLIRKNRDINGLEMVSILGVAIAMTLLSLSELDEFSYFNYIGIPLCFIGVLSSASAPVLAKQHIFRKYSPERTEILFFHRMITALFLAMGVAPQLKSLLFHNWFETHLLGFAEMLMLSVVSYGSLSFMFIIIDMFGPTNSELVECTSLVTSVLFSYYFIESGSEFVVIHIIAICVFIGAFAINVHSLSQKQKEFEVRAKKSELKHLKQVHGQMNEGFGSSSWATIVDIASVIVHKNTSALRHRETPVVEEGTQEKMQNG